MDAIETELRDLLDWIAEHDDEAANAAVDLQMLLDGGGLGGLWPGLLLEALYENETASRTVEIVDPNQTATGRVLVYVHQTIELVRNVVPAYQAANANKSGPLSRRPV